MYCTKCGQNLSGKLYCGNCGTAKGSPAQAPAPAPAHPHAHPYPPPPQHAHAMPHPAASRSKKTILIVSLALLVAVGGVGGFFVFRAFFDASIVGTWRTEEGAYITFNRDGTGFAEMPDIRLGVEGMGEVEDFTWIVTSVDDIMQRQREFSDQVGDLQRRAMVETDYSRRRALEEELEQLLDEMLPQLEGTIPFHYLTHRDTFANFDGVVVLNYSIHPFLMDFGFILYDQNTLHIFSDHFGRILTPVMALDGRLQWHALERAR